MMYLVNENYSTTRPVVMSFEELLNDKALRESFGCNFIVIGEFSNHAEACKFMMNKVAEAWE